MKDIWANAGIFELVVAITLAELISQDILLPSRNCNPDLEMLNKQEATNNNKKK